MPLSKRLCVAADFVRDGVFVVDVGTDHAYLAVELFRRGRVAGVLACDIAEGPLMNAARNVEAAGLRDAIKLRQSDGLASVQPEEADDIIIAGMGGDLIARILDEAEWVRDGNRNLILQPMSSADDLRDWLAANGFIIKQERAVEDGGRLYSVMLVVYDGQAYCPPDKFRYIGAVSAASDEGRRYMEGQVLRLCRHAEQLRQAAGEHPEGERLLAVADAIRRQIAEQSKK